MPFDIDVNHAVVLTTMMNYREINKRIKIHHYEMIQLYEACGFENRALNILIKSGTSAMSTNRPDKVGLMEWPEMHQSCIKELIIVFQSSTSRLNQVHQISTVWLRASKYTHFIDDNETFTVHPQFLSYKSAPFKSTCFKLYSVSTIFESSQYKRIIYCKKQTFIKLEKSINTIINIDLQRDKRKY